MRSGERTAALAIAALACLVGLSALAACGGGGGGGTQQPQGGGDAEANVIPLSVNGAHCGGRGAYVNQPCVTVTVCAPGTSDCTTIPDVLLDTGSFGLRLFRQALGGLSLPQVAADAGGALATCVQFADLSSDWGPVQRADVVLGGEPAVQVPVHVLDAGFGAPPASCPNPEAGPAAAGFNGILGVGVFPQDCGGFCASEARNGIYFSCTGGACGPTTAALADQVQNPAARLPGDGNGVIVDLPAVDPAGAGAVEGRLLLGVGTRPDNAESGAAVLPLDPRTATFATALEGMVLNGSFLDTGSNGLFFSAPSPDALPACAAPASAWYCPATRQSLTAINGSATTPFEVDDFGRLIGSGRRVFPDLGGPALTGAGFDWGLPFFLGRRVALVYEGSSSPLGQGPLAAY
jgi:hypothetical protein